MPTKPTPTKKTGFLDLPYEIRSMIYDNYLPPCRPSSRAMQSIDRLAKDLAKGRLCKNRAGQWSRINGPHHFVRNLLLVSRQICYEVLGELLNRFRISVPNLLEPKGKARPAEELEVVFRDLQRKGHTIRHLAVDINPMISTSTSRSVVSTTPRRDLSSKPSSSDPTSLSDLDLDKDVWDLLLPDLASLTINVSPNRLPEEWKSKVLAILRYVDASVTDRCVVEVNALLKQDRTLIEQAMKHPRLKIVVQAEEEEEWWEMHGSPD